MKIKKMILASMLFNSIAVQADIKPATLFNSKMVIQRDTQAPIWGKADAGEKVLVKASWGARAETITDKNGKWMVKLATPNAGGPHSISLEGKNKITLNDVLSGDVWLCSGQSNMEWRVQALKGSQKDT